MTAKELDRSDPLPLWAQLEKELDRRLRDGEFDSGKFPTDLELTNAYGVSRHTVREAIRHLNAKTGLLKRERGRGTVVDRSEFEQSFGSLYSLFQSVEAAGGKQTSEILQLEVVQNAEPAAHLDLVPDADLILVSRLRRVDGAPLAVDRAWLPAGLAAPLLEVDWSHTALYEELDKAGAPVPTEGWERLSPILPTKSDREHLDLSDSDAAFYLERLGRRDGQAIEWRATVLRCDRYRFLTDWSVGSRHQFRPSAQ